MHIYIQLEPSYVFKACYRKCPWLYKEYNHLMPYHIENLREFVNNWGNLLTIWGNVNNMGEFVYNLRKFVNSWENLSTIWGNLLTIWGNLSKICGNVLTIWGNVIWCYCLHLFNCRHHTTLKGIVFMALFSVFRLKAFYFQSSNLQYFKNLVQVPLLPDVSNKSAQ